jgi:release factor glutamine methyltransferase
MSNIQTALDLATQCLSLTSDSPSLDAEVLLCHVLDKPRSHLRAWPEKELLSHNYQHFLQLLKQRQKGTPIAYITGHKEFWSRDFKVTPDVLIPRPDTELLIELSLDIIANRQGTHILDLGTGSGVIAITLACEHSTLHVTATDMSIQALDIAQQNAALHQTNNIHFLQSNWFKNISESTFDLIISNPPYIADNDPHLAQGDVRFEPNHALTAKDEGLSDINQITDNARDYLAPNGTLLIEHGYNQQSAVHAIFQHFNYDNINTYSDLSSNPRVTTGQWNPT